MTDRTRDKPGLFMRAIQVLRKEGARGLVFRVLARTIYRRAILFERSLDVLPEIAAPLPITISQLQEHEINDYLALHSEADPADIRRRLQAGQWCFIVRHTGCIVHACWAAAGRVWIEYLGREIELAPDEVYFFESLTALEWRKQNLASARSIAMARFFREAGYRRSVAIVVPENIPARRAVEKVGYHPIGTIGYIKLGKWRHNFDRVNRTAR